MERFKIGNDLLINWRFVYSDGTPFPLTGYTYDLMYYTGRGTSAVEESSVVGESGNVLSWTFKAEDQTFAGNYDLCLRLYLNGVMVATFTKKNAFALGLSTALEEGAQMITLESVCDSASINDAILRANKAGDRAIAAAIVDEHWNEIFTEREPRIVTAEDPDEPIDYVSSGDDTEYPDITI